MDFTPKQKAWILLVCMLLGTFCGVTATAWAGGCKLPVAILTGIGSACMGVVHALMRSPRDIEGPISQQPPQPQPAQQGNDTMKKIASLITLLGLSLGITVQAQTLNTNGVPSLEGPAMDAIHFLSASATNWMIAPYGIATSEGKYGAGIAAAYKLSDYVAPTMRLDYFDGKVWMPSADLQLQAPLTLFGKLTLVPFAFTGIATPIAGKGAANGSVVGMFGAGAAVRLSNHLDLVGDVEKWTGFSGQQYRFGFLYKF